MVTIFIHIPRTGGTTFTTTIRNNVESQYLCHYDAAKENFSHIAHRVKPWSPHKDYWITGHVGYNVHSVLPHEDYRYISIVRDPVDRVWSYFNLLTTQMNRPDDDLIRLVYKYESNLDKIMDSHEVPDFCNDQSRLLLGRAVLNDSSSIEEVIKHVRDKYFYVGTTDKLGEMIQDVGYLYYWPDVIMPFLDYPKHPRILSLLAEKVRKYNVVDQALYEYVRDKHIGK